MAKSNYKLPTKKFNFNFGNDLEAFLFDRKQGKIVSAIEVLKHGKDDPINLGSNTYAYFDNLLLEYKFNNPYSTKEGMVERIGNTLKKVQGHLGERYGIVHKAGHTFDDSEVKDPRALEIGCSPSFDCYNCSIVENSPFKDNFRTSGGHIHMSEDNGLFSDFQIRINTIKLMDIFVGTSNVIYSNDPSEKQRRLLYGMPGNHRIPTYGKLQGLEYRTLSSSFLNSREKAELTYDLTQHALSHIVNGTCEDVLKSVDENMVINAISKCDKKLAEKVLIKAELPSSLLARVKIDYKDNFEKSWDLN